MKNMTFVDYIRNVLQEREGIYFTVPEIAKFIVSDFPDYCKKRMEKSGRIKDVADLLEQFQREIYSANSQGRLDQDIIVAATSPKKLAYFSEGGFSNKEVLVSHVGKKKELREQDLYSLLGKFLADDLNIYAKRINEKKSSNTNGRNGNKWLYPDVVGMRVLSDNWDDNIKRCIKHYQGSETDLWSFEVKVSLTMANVRESFFQTVSNSSWANYSYLVAADIEEKALKDLRILSEAHNIGVIKLDIDNIQESQILIPAPKTELLDWNVMNRICSVNSDFKDFVAAVDNFYSANPKNKIQETHWMACPGKL